MIRYLIIFIASVFFVGCVSTSDFSFQDKIGNAAYKIPVQEKNVEILGIVQKDMTATNMFFILTNGGPTYSELLSEAKAKYGADDVVNVRVDILSSSYFLVYNAVTYRVTGTAIKYSK